VKNVWDNNYAHDWMTFGYREVMNIIISLTMNKLPSLMKMASLREKVGTRRESVQGV
jgi:hypothetical protein